MNQHFDQPLIMEMLRTGTRNPTTPAITVGKLSQIPEVGKSLFTVHTARQWMELEKDKPAPYMLFGELWYQGEICIMFADTNVGKSILAVQIGVSLAGRRPIAPFGFEAPQCNVAYIDFELTSNQFAGRYKHNDVSHDFPKNFYRATYNPPLMLPPEFKTYNDYMNAAIEHVVDQANADVLIIDNITCLRQGTDRASEALPLMQHLKSLQAKHNLSILVLAHTPKRNTAKAISQNDLQGSKMLINFCDSAFAIGESRTQPGIRYLKQVKQRNGRQLYGAKNVCLYRIAKPGNFLQMQFTGYGYEADHLRPYASQSRKDAAVRVCRLHKQGLSFGQISRQLNMAKTTVQRVVKRGGVAAEG